MTEQISLRQRVYLLKLLSCDEACLNFPDF
jgi:hypothetical protein